MSRNLFFENLGGPALARHHALEFEDLEFFPRRLRSGITGILKEIHRVVQFPRAIAEILTQLREETGHTEIIDMGSGSGGAMPEVAKILADQNSDLQITLTDLFPNPDAITQVEDLDLPIRFHPRSVNAAALPTEFNGIRTMSASFHHLPPNTATHVLRDAFERRAPIVIVEITSRTTLGFLSNLPAPLYALILAPFIRPFRWQHLFFTWLLPIIPLVLLWDGMASCMRTYMPAELRKMTADLQADDYKWEIGMRNLGLLPLRVPYLIGKPVDQDTR